MRQLVAWLTALTFAVSPAMAGTSGNAEKSPSQPAKAAESSAPAAKASTPAKTEAAAKPENRSDSAIAAEIEELRQALQAQQEQLTLLKEELAKRDRQIDEARDAAAAANARAAEASIKATNAVNATAEVKSTADTLNTTVANLKASNEVLKTAVATEQVDAKKASEEGPASIRYKGVNITPGGFLAAETVFRTRNDNADINSDFRGIPYPGNANSKVTESNFSGRQSRLFVVVDSKVGSAKVTGYYEGDFLGTGVTSNNRQSNSYVFRQRQAWAGVVFDSGFTVSGGQMWSLVTESKKGIQNRQEAFPLQIDAQYIVGWAWARAYAFRVAQNWDKFAVGFSIEGPQTTVGGRSTPSQPVNFFVNAPGSGAGLFNFIDTSGYTINRSPDFLIKATLDPGWGHYEVVGILSPFRNRVYPCGAFPGITPLRTGCATATSVAGAFNDTRVGGGIGVTGRFPLIAKKLDAVAHFQGGDGIGRYSSAQIQDVTWRPNGTLAPIRTAAWLGSLEWHPTPKIDAYAYGGGEYAARTAFTYFNTAGSRIAFGYGNPFFNNSGCSTEAFPTQGPANSSPTAPAGGTPCAGDIRQILEGTLGLWYKFYQSSKGRMQFGVQYSYLTKVGWSGNNNNQTAGTPPVLLPAVAPKATNNMVFTSFRYYLP
jgi:hypothetical protein